MLKPREKVEDKLQHREEFVKKRIDSLNSGKVPEENFPKVHLSIGNDYQQIALFKMALGNCKAAIPEFETSAEWYYDGARETRERRDSLSEDFEGGTTLLKYFYSALLAGDEDLLTQATEIAFETEESHYHQFSETHRYYLLNALAATVAETGDQQAYLDELEATLDDLPDDHDQYFGGLWRALSGIVTDDTKLFSEGVDQFLDWHDNNVNFENKTSPEDLVCKQVVALLVLARRNGMDVHVDSPYIPDCVSDLV